MAQSHPFRNSALAALSMGLLLGCSQDNTKPETPPTEAAETVLSPEQRNRIAGVSKSWPKSPPSLDYDFNALDPGYRTTAVADSRFDPSDEYWGLPREPGYEEVAIYCTACHSLQIVMSQRQSREGWQKLLTWMVKEQGMPPLDPADEKIILDYLSKHFSN